MAEKLASLKQKGGGDLRETVLWTNANPNASAGFPAQSVTLSDNISHYKYIVIVCRWSNDAQSGNGSTKYIYDATELPNCTGGTSYYPVPYLGMFYGGLTYYYRNILYDSDTSLSFSQCYYNRTNVAPTVNNGAAIPVQIIGLK